MLNRRCAALLSRSERGLYFPIAHRVVDERIDANVVYEADVQTRPRRQLRTGFSTGETRQTEVPAWSQRVPPTHFLSLPLPARNVLVNRVKEMHKSIIFSHAEVEPLLIPTAKLHVTLGVLSLPEGDAKKLKAVQECVAEACRRLPAPTAAGLRLHFRGLGTFGGGRVLFLRCQCEEHYPALDAFVRALRKDMGVGLGVDVKGNPHDSYVPHITVAKIRPGQRREFGRQIPISAWADHQHQDFGAVTFEKVDLCSMKGRGENGYYKIESSARLTR